MSLFGFGEKARQWNAKKKQALQAMAIAALGEFEGNFDKEGIGGKRWKEVQRRIPGTQAYRRADASGRVRPILHGESTQLETNTEIASVNSSEAVIVNNTPYAQLHNEGGINSKGGRVPARPFMKQTKALTKEQLTILKDVTGEIWSVK